MISARTKENVSYIAASALIVVITAGCAGALIYLGFGFMRRIFG